MDAGGATRVVDFGVLLESNFYTVVVIVVVHGGWRLVGTEFEIHHGQSWRLEGYVRHGP